MDGFDRLPDSLILLIFNSVSDIKTLIRCRSVSKRFNSLVPQADSLLLRVDCVISPESDSDSVLLTFLKTIFKSLHDLLLSPKPAHPIRSKSQSQNSPAQILSQFDRIRRLEVELPAGDLRLEKGAVVKWKAEFGRTLKSCVIVGFRAIRVCGSGYSVPNEGDTEFAVGLKTRVVWTISTLIAASARHFLLKEVVKGHREMERVTLKDREGEGTVVMEKEGLRECREEECEGAGEVREDELGWERSRTVVPCVRMRMRHEPRLQLKCGVWVEGATLVVVRPIAMKDGGGSHCDVEVDGDAELALVAFGDDKDGIYGEVVRALLSSRSYLLEMNSF